jgi:hypothetical protein
MGQAKRRKQLDPNYGKKSWFEIELCGKIDNSWVLVKVRDSANNREATANFHLYTIRDRMYAEVAIPREEMSLNGWLAKNIDAISPLISKEVLRNVDALIVQ